MDWVQYLSVRMSFYLSRMGGRALFGTLMGTIQQNLLETKSLEKNPRRRWNMTTLSAFQLDVQVENVVTQYQNTP